jgi:hypothetical protein
LKTGQDSIPENRGMNIPSHYIHYRYLKGCRQKRQYLKMMVMQWLKVETPRIKTKSRRLILFFSYEFPLSKATRRSLKLRSDGFPSRHHCRFGFAWTKLIDVNKNATVRIKIP